MQKVSKLTWENELKPYIATYVNEKRRRIPFFVQNKVHGSQCQNSKASNYDRMQYGKGWRTEFAVLKMTNTYVQKWNENTKSNTERSKLPSFYWLHIFKTLTVMGMKTFCKSPHKIMLRRRKKIALEKLEDFSRQVSENIPKWFAFSQICHKSHFELRRITLPSWRKFEGVIF